MEGGSGQNSVPPISLDKSRVLDVKPLRSLVPLFSGPPQAPPFVSVPPFGPFPSGFSPFYPFSTPQGSQSSADLNQHNPYAANQTPQGAMPSPIRSFKSPQSTTSVPQSKRSAKVKDNGFLDSEKGGARSSQKKAKNSKNLDFTLSVDGEGYDFGIRSLQQEDGNREIVIQVLMAFDGLRRRISQLEDSKEAMSGLIRRADLKAGNIVMSKGLRTNKTRRIGSIPGVEIGDIFFFRMEMCAIGLHAPSMGGIDYLTAKGTLEEEPVALSIVSSGGYDDDAEDSDVLIYSGQGGNVNNKQASDQKLERGNLALERSLRRGNEVRVIRGIKDAVSPLKVYVYDGLYKVQETWVEKAKSGCNLFKYKLARMPGQPGVFSVWKSVQKWREGLSSRPGLILPDLTSGAERIPVSLVNDVDDEKGPAYFTYVPTLKYSKSYYMIRSSFGCNCLSSCVPGDLNCSCIRKNGGDFPYTTHGVLVSRKPLLHECGPTCPCYPNCKNRVSQTGLKVHLEVFKTKDRGWALRSWDPIRAGTFICEYAGEVVDKIPAKRVGDESEGNEYVFDTTRVYDAFKWNYEPVLLDEEKSSDSSTEDYDIPSPLFISSKKVGNVSRFMNHSCSPNVFWQPVLYEHSAESFLHIAFFAMRHIPPMTELTYDYGIACSDGVEGNNTHHTRKKCLCGSTKCRGYFG